MSVDSALIEQLLQEQQRTLSVQTVRNCVLTVKETEHYRWFTYGGSSLQSLMNKRAPEQLTTVVSHALLLFVLFDKGRKRILNLGMGGGTIERALSAHSEYQVTSVESSQAIITLSKEYFLLPPGASIVCQDAETFVNASLEHYDVVVCDLFEDEALPAFLSQEEFYSGLHRITVAGAVLMLNIQVATESELLKVLLSVRKHFPHVALIEFDNYKNLVAVCSASALPDKRTLVSRLVGYSPIDFSCLAGAIANLRYLPA